MWSERAVHDRFRENQKCLRTDIVEDVAVRAAEYCRSRETDANEAMQKLHRQQNRDTVTV